MKLVLVCSQYDVTLRNPNVHGDSSRIVKAWVPFGDIWSILYEQERWKRLI